MQSETPPPDHTVTAIASAISAAFGALGVWAAGWWKSNAVKEKAESDEQASEREEITERIGNFMDQQAKALDAEREARRKDQEENDRRFAVLQRKSDECEAHRTLLDVKVRSLEAQARLRDGKSD